MSDYDMPMHPSEPVEVIARADQRPTFEAPR